MTAGEHDEIDDDKPITVHCMQNKAQHARDDLSHGKGGESGDITVHGWHEDEDIFKSKGKSLLSKLGKSLKCLKAFLLQLKREG